MMDIVIDGPDYIFANEKYVLCNTTITDFTLKKKEKIIAYHIVR